jgi:transposase
MRRKGTQSELERTRLIAANMFDQGLSTLQIAAALEADDQTVRRWRRTYAAKGRDGLRRTRTHPGRPPLLGEAQRARLAGLLEQGPAACGLDRHLWTTQLVADLIAREFGVTYHHDHVGVLLGALGFTHQKPARRARERDEARIEAWRRDDWPALLKKVPMPAG